MATRFPGHSVVFGEVQDAGAKRVNMHVELMADLPCISHNEVVLKPTCILSFYANIKLRPMCDSVSVIKELITEDWTIVGHGAVEIARRYMLDNV